MNMRCDEAQELITAWVDHELSAGEQVAVEAHLNNCPACKSEFERESVLKRRIRLAGLQIRAPAELRRLIEEKTTRTIPVKKAWRDWNFRSWLALPTWRRAVISAMLVLVVVLVISIRERDDTEGGFANEAVEIHASIIRGKTSLLRAVNLPAMRKELAQAVGDRFKPLVLDLSIAKLHPVAGFVQNIRGREALVTVYEGDSPAITCFTFLGSDSDAPPGAERFYDAAMSVNYYFFSRGDLNAVLHQEGEVMCLLVSKMAPAEMLALLRGKSAHG